MSPKVSARAARVSLVVLAAGALVAGCSTGSAGQHSVSAPGTRTPSSPSSVLDAATAAKPATSTPTGRATGTPSTATPATATPTPGTRWGVTVDDVGNLNDLVASLKALPARPTARIVFDLGQNPDAYTDAVRSLHSAADLMATPVDSSDAAKYSADAYKARFQDYLSAFGNETSLWEIGNEINGEWTGPSADSAAKAAAAFDLVHAAGKATALTLYYNPQCWSDQGHEMLPWAAKWIPERVKQHVDYVFVSYYEKDCNNRRPDRAEWQQVFGRLRALFPSAHLGFGEIGADQHADPAAKAAYLTRYYTMPAPVSNFVGGYFWWYYAEDAVPYTRSPVWAALRAAMAAASPAR